MRRKPPLPVEPEDRDRIETAVGREKEPFVRRKPDRRRLGRPFEEAGKCRHRFKLLEPAVVVTERRHTAVEFVHQVGDPPGTVEDQVAGADAGRFDHRGADPVRIDSALRVEGIAFDRIDAEIDHNQIVPVRREVGEVRMRLLLPLRIDAVSGMLDQPGQPVE